MCSIGKDVEDGGVSLSVGSVGKHAGGGVGRGRNGFWEFNLRMN